jgi:hypothetical protein
MYLGSWSYEWRIFLVVCWTGTNENYITSITTDDPHSKMQLKSILQLRSETQTKTQNFPLQVPFKHFMRPQNETYLTNTE